MDDLKRMFPGVLGRISDLCSPTQRKYNLAITIATGMYMDCVVVEQNKTAIECIRYD